METLKYMEDLFGVNWHNKILKDDDIDIVIKNYQKQLLHFVINQYSTNEPVYHHHLFMALLYKSLDIGINIDSSYIFLISDITEYKDLLIYFVSQISKNDFLYDKVVKQLLEIGEEKNEFDYTNASIDDIETRIQDLFRKLVLALNEQPRVFMKKYIAMRKEVSLYEYSNTVTLYTKLLYRLALELCEEEIASELCKYENCHEELMTYITDTNEFYMINDDKSKKDVRNMSRFELFSRRSIYECSVFEELLIENKHEELSFVINKFKVSNVLHIKNYMNKRLFDYAKTDETVINLILSCNNEGTIVKNALCIAKGESIMDKQFRLVRENNKLQYKNLEILFTYLEDSSRTLEQCNAIFGIHKKRIADIIKSKLNETSGGYKLYIPKLHFYVCLLEIFWKTGTLDEESNVVFKLLNSIIYEDLKNFIKDYAKVRYRFQSVISELYGLPINVKLKYVSYTFHYLFLFGAMRMRNVENAKCIIDEIIDRCGIHNLRILVPQTMVKSEVTSYALSKMIESGYEVWREFVPNSWFTPNMVNDLLDKCKITNNFSNVEFVIKNCEEACSHPEMKKSVREEMYKYRWLLWLYFILLLSCIIKSGFWFCVCVSFLNEVLSVFYFMYNITYELKHVRILDNLEIAKLCLKIKQMHSRVHKLFHTGRR